MYGRHLVFDILGIQPSFVLRKPKGTRKEYREVLDMATNLNIRSDTKHPFNYLARSDIHVGPVV